MDVIVSKTTSGKVQVVFRDGTGGRDGHALQLAEGLKEELQTGGCNPVVMVTARRVGLCCHGYVQAGGTVLSWLRPGG